MRRYRRLLPDTALRTLRTTGGGCLPTNNDDQLTGEDPPPANKFSVYEPNYFLSAFNKGDFGHVKFKISFKYSLGWPGFLERLGTSRRDNQLYFAYTQQSFWDLYSYSSPMRDVNFEPMLHWEHTFHTKADPEKTRGRWVGRFDSYKLGGLHESNGQEGERNRSLFQLYAHAGLSLTHNTDNCRFGLKRVELRPTVWAWIGLADDNKDIAEYRGYGQLVTSFLFDYRSIRRTAGMYPLQVDHILIPAVHTTSVTSVAFNPFLSFSDSGWWPTLYFQHWYGYGESLLNYDNRLYGFKAKSTFRAGIQFRFQ